MVVGVSLPSKYCRVKILVFYFSRFSWPGITLKNTCSQRNSIPPSRARSQSSYAVNTEDTNRSGKLLSCLCACVCSYSEDR